MAAQKQWGKEDDEKLAELFRRGTSRGGLDPTDLNNKTIHKIIERHFPSRTYKNFAPLFRKKARAWNLAQTLNGARSDRKKQQEDKEEEKDSQEDKEEEDSEDEFDPLDSSEVEGLIDDQENDPVGVPAPVDSNLSSKFEKVSFVDNKKVARMAAYAEHSMEFKYPYMLYKYDQDGRERVAVNFLVPTQDESKYRPVVEASKDVLTLSTVIPPFFPTKDRLLSAEQENDKFNDNTHKATALEKICTKIVNQHKKLDEEDEEEVIIRGNPQRVKLPIKVEEEIVRWECQYYNVDEDHYDLEVALGGEIFWSVLTVEMVSMEKKKKKTVGGRRVVGSHLKARGNNKEKAKPKEEEEDAGDANMNEEY